jgi:flagellar protein FlaJ
MSLDTVDQPDGGIESVANSIADLFQPLYQRIFDEEQPFVQNVESKLQESRMSDNVEVYLSRSLGVGVLSGVLLALIGATIGYILFSVLNVVETLKDAGSLPASIPTVAGGAEILVVLTIAIGLGIVGFAGGFGTLVSIPYFRASGRKREINVLLADSIAFMYALSEGGLNQLEVIRAVAEAEDTYGEVSKEFQSVLNESEYFDTDYKTAIRQQAQESPSRELRQFLTDMLSIIDSGGNMTRFFSDKKDKHMRTAKRQREMTLDTLELFGEMYMTLSMFPLLLIIVFVIMGMLGNSTTLLIFGTVYLMIPMIGVAFLVMVATVKSDEPGDGYLSYRGDTSDIAQYDQGVLSMNLANSFAGTHRVFDRIKSRELVYEVVQHLKHPHIFFKNNPLYVLGVTVPVSVVAVAAVIATGSVNTSWIGIKEEPVWSTFVYLYLPVYINCVPLGIFYEWNVRARAGITNTLSDDLRQLASANSTGMTLLQSIKTVAETSSGKLSQEFEIIGKKVEYGMSLEEALIEFNNKYHIPRLSRTVKLITEAQRASNQISNVLATAAQASENNDDIEQERSQRTMMQVAIIIMTFLSLLGVMAILQTQFIGTLARVTSEAASSTSGGGGPAGGGGAGFGGNIDPNQLSLLFFHAVTFQAITSGLIAGYFRDAKILSGIKFLVILLTIAMIVWIGVAFMSEMGVIGEMMNNSTASGAPAGTPTPGGTPEGTPTPPGTPPPTPPPAAIVLSAIPGPW